MKRALVAGILCWLTGATAGEPPEWRLLPEKSNLSFEFKEAGITESGQFRRFDATFRFDPDRPAQEGRNGSLPAASCGGASLAHPDCRDVGDKGVAEGFRLHPANFSRGARGGFEVLVDMASADTGDTERDRLLRGPDLFHVERWPESHFKTLEIEHLGGDRYLARAELTIRDKTRRLDFPFTLRFAGRGGEQTFTLESDIVLQRLDYGVGQGEWRETAPVRDEVRVIARVEAVRAP